MCYDICVTLVMIWVMVHGGNDICVLIMFYDISNDMCNDMCIDVYVMCNDICVTCFMYL